jgi:hypothetical protein
MCTKNLNDILSYLRSAGCAASRPSPDRLESEQNSFKNPHLFCRLYFIATSGVCLIRSGTVGFQKKLQSQKKKHLNLWTMNRNRASADCSKQISRYLSSSQRGVRRSYTRAYMFSTPPQFEIASLSAMAFPQPTYHRRHRHHHHHHHHHHKYHRSSSINKAAEAAAAAASPS